MSKEFPQFSEEETDQPQASAKPKRLVKGTGRKPAADKRSKSREPSGNPEVLQAPVAEAKVVEEKPVAKPVAEIETIWEDATPESVGGAASAGEGGNKRKRRRRKGKGGGSSAPVEVAEVAVSTAPVNLPAQQSSQSSQTSKTRIDPETLAKAAWKIYLSEVSEEGVALVGDQDARELARRCFRLAEIFLEERGRR